MVKVSKVVMIVVALGMSVLLSLRAAVANAKEKRVAAIDRQEDCKLCFVNRCVQRLSVWARYRLFNGTPLARAGYLS